MFTFKTFFLVLFSCVLSSHGGSKGHTTTSAPDFGSFDVDNFKQDFNDFVSIGSMDVFDFFSNHAKICFNVITNCGNKDWWINEAQAFNSACDFSVLSKIDILYENTQNGVIYFTLMSSCANSLDSNNPIWINQQLFVYYNNYGKIKELHIQIQT